MCPLYVCNAVALKAPFGAKTRCRDYLFSVLGLRFHRQSTRATGFWRGGSDRPELYSFRALWRRYRSCRRNKRNTFNALAFEVDAEARLLALQEELRTHSYRPGRSICFTTAGPKPREVFAADFRDRIVHHLLVSHQERVFEPLFIHDSFACRKDKGTLAASDRLMAFLRRVTVNGRRAAWALKLDVASFFPSIHKATLDAILACHIRHPELVWLTRTLLFHDPTSNYRFRSLTPGAPGPESRRYPIPPEKSLFGKENACGCRSETSRARSGATCT